MVALAAVLLLSVAACRDQPAERPPDRTCAETTAALARADKHKQENDFERAAVEYRKAIPGLGACGDSVRRAQAEWDFGQSLLETGELRQATTILEGAAGRFHELGDNAREARAANQLGAAWRRLGQPDRALAAYQRALRLYRKSGDLAGEATTLNNIGLVFKSVGDLQGAIGQYEASLALWRQLGMKSYEAVTLQNLGTLYVLIGHDAEALDLLRQALKGLSGDQDARQRGSALVALGWAEYLVGQPEAALERYREALALAGRTGDHLAKAGILDRRGTALRALHRYPEAAASYAQALALCRKEGRRLSEGHTLTNLGWLDLETGAPARARQRLEQARELLAASRDPNGEVYALVGLGRAERLVSAFGAAREHLNAALRLVEGMRADLHGPASRGQFLATRYNAYEELVSLLMELDRREPAAGHAREALEVAERARARNLLDRMAGDPEAARGVAGGGGRRASLAAEIEVMEERRRTLAAENPHDPRLSAIDAALRSRWLEADRLAAAPAPQASFTSLREIQSIADADTLLVCYLLAEPASFAWTVDQGTAVSHVLPGKERIERLARRVIAALPHSHEAATLATTARATRELSEAVLAPLAQRLAGRKRLVILADGALHLIPFGALPAPAERLTDTPEPLLVRHEIVTLPSATVLLSQRRRLAGRHPAPRTVAVLADPVFSRTDDRLASSKAGLAAGRSDEGMGLERLHRLPHTAEEARAIVELVPEQEALLATGLAARRDLAMSGALRHYRILHFATHGLLDPVLPERSGLVLSLYDENGKRRDGFLSAPDIATLELPAELAVLSACDTALGRELRGEGLVGLTQAFFRAGVRGVVVGYWSVDDRATAALMARFYRNLLSAGLPPAAALRDAQLATRSEEKWRAPYYWAGFSFHGDWRQEQGLMARVR